MTASLNTSSSYNRLVSRHNNLVFALNGILSVSRSIDSTNTATCGVYCVWIISLQNIAELRKTLTHFQNNSLPQQGTGRPLNSKPENRAPPEDEQPSRHLLPEESTSSRNGSDDTLTSGIVNHGAVEEVTSDSGIEQSCSETQSDIDNLQFNRQPVPNDGTTLMEAMRESEHFRALIDQAHGITEHTSNQGDVLKLNSPESQNEAVPEIRTNGREEVLASSRMSPESFTTFKDHLDHIPEMNLPWQAMRSVPRCSCGTAFTFSTRKV